MMRLLSAFVAFALFSMFVFSCKSKETPTTADEANAISQDVLSRIAALGFSTEGIKIEPDGYIVENDIFLPKHELEHAAIHQTLVVGQSEQYRTTNLVTGLPRVITVSLSNQLSGYSAALDIALARYNAENLQLTFQRVTSGAAIAITRGNGNFLASAGFPSGGAPFNSIRINSSAIGSGTSATFNNYVATILAHEIGHCIGFRHTDYMNRAYSCGGTATNEGASTVGAILIPGTPSGPDPNSWMLACIGSNQSRPFNANDKTALNFLY
jgi:predicted Zn-dependent protease